MQTNFEFGVSFQYPHMDRTELNRKANSTSCVLHIILFLHNQHYVTDCKLM